MLLSMYYICIMVRIRRDVTRAMSWVLEASTLVVTGPDLSFDLIHQLLKNSVPVVMATVINQRSLTYTC